MIQIYRDKFAEQKSQFKSLVESQDLTMVKLMQEIKPKFINKNEIIAELTVKIKESKLVEEKKEIGGLKKIIHDELNQIFLAAKERLEKQEIQEKLMQSRVDGTLDLKISSCGSIHPITYTANEVIRIFKSLGFSLRFGPEVESSYYNFTVLNMDKNHPARQMHDTFYLNSKCEKDETRVLRTHTTAVDIKTLLKLGSPLKVISFGKTFRKDQDKTHTPMFHQLEVLHVDKGLSLANLKDLLLKFLSEFFQSDSVKIRMRTSFFPFTEPSLEVDIKYRSGEDGRIIIDEKGDKYMEILGCGMLHPNVLKNANVPEGYRAIAAGVGIERLAMLKYGIDDLREFFKSDIKWLNKNSFLSHLY